MNEFESISYKIEVLIKCQVNDRNNIIKTAIRRSVGITTRYVSDNLIKELYENE